VSFLIFFCTPAGGRTLDTLIKSQVLYQLSYKRILVAIAGAKVKVLFCSAKHFIGFLSKMLRKATHGPLVEA
jgi:hypothetical protein